MSDLLAECDWRDGTLFLVLPEDPERIGVRLFPSRHAPSRMYVPMAEAARLKDENAKLRELVLRLWECPVDDNKCTDCPHCKEHYDVCAGENHCKLYDHMRELGVEVE